MIQEGAVHGKGMFLVLVVVLFPLSFLPKASPTPDMSFTITQEHGESPVRR